MVSPVNLEQDASPESISRPPSNQFSAPSLQFSSPLTRSTFSALLTPYPILSSLSAELDQTDLHNLSIANKQVYLNMREYLPTLARLCLKCRFSPKVLVAEKTCARGLVKRCTLCREPSCRECTWHPSSQDLERRLRMVCEECNAAIVIRNKLTEEEIKECDCRRSIWLCEWCAATSYDGNNMGMEGGSGGKSGIFGNYVVSTGDLGKWAEAKRFCMMDCPVREAHTMSEDLEGRRKKFRILPPEKLLKVEHPSAAAEGDEFTSCVNVKLSVISSNQQEQNELESNSAFEPFETLFSLDNDEQYKASLHEFHRLHTRDVGALCYSTGTQRYYVPGFIFYPLEINIYCGRAEFVWYFRGGVSPVGQGRQVGTGEEVDDKELKLVLYTDKMMEERRCKSYCAWCRGIVYLKGRTLS